MPVLPTSLYGLLQSRSRARCGPVRSKQGDSKQRVGIRLEWQCKHPTPRWVHQIHGIHPLSGLTMCTISGSVRQVDMLSRGHGTLRRKCGYLLRYNQCIVRSSRSSTRYRRGRTHRLGASVIQILTNANSRRSETRSAVLACESVNDVGDVCRQDPTKYVNCLLTAIVGPSTVRKLPANTRSFSVG